MAKEEGRYVLIPPTDFYDYEWNDDFKLMMFCLEFTRNEMSGNPTGYAVELAKEWGFGTPQEIYDKLWSRFEYYKGRSFDEQFKCVESHVDCPICKQTIFFAEVKPMRVSEMFSTKQSRVG